MQRSSFKKKAISLAIGLSILPIAIASAIEFWFASQSLEHQSKIDQEESAILMADAVGRFMTEAHGDIQMMANLPILNDPEIVEATSLREKQETLDRFIQNYGIYDSIGFATPDGRTLFHVGLPDVNDYSKTEFFQTTLSSKKPVISPPQRSNSGGYVIYVAAPVTSVANGKISGVVYARIPETKLEEAFIQHNPIFQEREHFFIDNTGTIFAALNRDLSWPKNPSGPACFGSSNSKSASGNNYGSGSQWDSMVIEPRPPTPNCQWA
jgi:methyl-accepting chemotaxis protein PixJ